MNKIVAIRVWLRDECPQCRGVGFIPIADGNGEIYDYNCDNKDCKEGYVETSKKLEITEFSRMLKNNEKG